MRGSGSIGGGGHRDEVGGRGLPTMLMGLFMRFIAAAVCALALAACAPTYRSVGQLSDDRAYAKAHDECTRDGVRLAGLNASAQQELFDDCMAAQGFVRTN
jgi:hypothetical protein